MATLSFIKPLDQPMGTRRLLDDLSSAFSNKAFDKLTILVAYAKIGPLLRLEKQFQQWKASGKKLSVTVGIDQQGTSLEAIDFLALHCDEFFIAHQDRNAGLTPTFHPKVYLFQGEKEGFCVIGSNNLTVGGTETNFEVATILELQFPADGETLSEIESWIEQTKSASLPVTDILIQELVNRGLVVSEADQRKAKRISRSVGKAGKFVDALFPPIHLKPASAVPKGTAEKAGNSSAKQLAKGVIKSRPRQGAKGVQPISATKPGMLLGDTLLMQVTPHKNGEVLLSLNAIKQNPTFFAWPFSGLTSPKKGRNKAYPQRTPDPKVNLRAFDSKGDLIFVESAYEMNTVEYELKSEIRVTFSPHILAVMPDRSILVIREALDLVTDYDITIYAPGSPEYSAFLKSCNQTMPSGGKPNPRKFGWI